MTSPHSFVLVRVNVVAADAYDGALGSTPSARPTPPEALALCGAGMRVWWLEPNALAR